MRHVRNLAGLSTMMTLAAVAGELPRIRTSETERKQDPDNALDKELISKAQAKRNKRNAKRLAV